MYRRIFDIESKLDEGMFLFGARQTGKSTLLKERFKGAIYYDLLNPNVRRALKLNPNSLWEALQDKPAGTLVIVDEIQKVPELLDVVHSLMVDRGLYFILSGSSSRKLKRSGANTLGGRAIPETLYPLVWPEVTDFQIDHAVQNGMIPRHYMVADATKRLSGYVKVYLDEEIREEGEVRELDAFERFMEVAAISDGEMLNYSNIAADCGVSAKTVKCIQFTYLSFFPNFLVKVHFHVARKTLDGIFHHIMTRYHTILDGTVYLEICHLRPYKRIKCFGNGTSSERVGPRTFQLPGTGTTEDEEQPSFHHQRMNHIQQFWNFLDFIHDDKRTGRLVLKGFPQGVGIQLKGPSYTRIKQIIINRPFEPLFQKCGFPCLTCAKQKHSFVQFALYVQESF